MKKTFKYYEYIFFFNYKQETPKSVHICRKSHGNSSQQREVVISLCRTEVTPLMLKPLCVYSSQGCGSLVSVSRSAGALSCRSTEDTSLPEILLGLIYNSATGQLSAEVIQGSHFKTTASDKPVSTYITLPCYTVLVLGFCASVEWGDDLWPCKLFLLCEILSCSVPSPKCARNFGKCFGKADGQDSQQRATKTNLAPLHLNVSWQQQQLFNNRSD